MLAGCSTSTTTTTVTEEPTVNTGVVAYVQANMGSSSKDDYNVGESQASQTLAGNEEAHKAIAIKALNGNFDNTTVATKTVSDLTASEIGTALYYTAGESYVLVIRKAGNTDKELAVAILDMLATRYANLPANESESNATRYCIASMSVFDATIDEILLPTVTVDGTDIDYNDYWVVVTTNATKKSTATTNNSTTVVE